MTSVSVPERNRSVPERNSGLANGNVFYCKSVKRVQGGAGAVVTQQRKVVFIEETDVPEGFHIDDLLYDVLVVDDPSTYPYIVPTPVYPDHEAPLYEIPTPGTVLI